VKPREMQTSPRRGFFQRGRQTGNSYGRGLGESIRRRAKSIIISDRRTVLGQNVEKVKGDGVGTNCHCVSGWGGGTGRCLLWTDRS